MTLYEAVVYVGLMMGSFSAGYIYEAYGSSSLIFLISAMSVLGATLVVIFVIPESLNSQQHTNVNSESSIDPSEQRDRSTIQKLFDIEHIKALYVTCFQWREQEMRSIILLIVGCLLICAFVVGKYSEKVSARKLF